jgi:ADP-heptose:LPS heptosyltransferase
MPPATRPTTDTIERGSPAQGAPHAPRRIHLYRPHNQLGDLLLNVPAIRAVRERWPAAHLILVVGRQNAAAVQGQPWADEVRVVGTRTFAGALGSLLSERGRRLLRPASRPDFAVYFTTVSYSRSGAMLVRGSGARERIGFDPSRYGEKDRARLTRSVPYPSPGMDPVAPKGSPPHQSEISLALARAAGVEGTPPPPYYIADPTLRSRAPKGIAYLHAGAGKLKNRWPAERFAAVAREIVARGVEVALLEGPQDQGTARAVIAALGGPLPIVAGEPIANLAARFAEGALYIGNDTGPLHLAGAVGCPTVGVYGWSDPREWHPVGRWVRGVRAADHSLESIPARDVLDVALSLMEERRCGRD